MVRLEKTAAPWLETTLFVPPSVPPTGFTPMAIVTAPLKLVTVLPLASCAVTCTAGLMTEPAPVFDGCIVNASWVTAIATRKSGLVLSPNETHGPAPPGRSHDPRCP